MDGFGSHTFSLIDGRGSRVWCKFHFKTQQGIGNLPAAEATRLAGEDPDYTTRDLYYDPNSHDAAPKQNCAYAEPAMNLGHVKVDRYDHHQGNDEYSQAGDLYRLLKPDAQQRLVDNIIGSLSGARQDIQMRQLCHFFRADRN